MNLPGSLRSIRAHGLLPPPAVACLLALLTILGPLASAASGGAARRGVADLTLEELMQLEVTTVAGVPQSRFTTPSAITVITADDLRRSGHRTLAEALRLVPGMFVARASASTWTVGPRGLIGPLTTTRSLVLIDGRVALDPLTNGAPWDALDIALDDVDRIEVIRGPGATLWGVNAVNGVINIITRNARDTAGAHLRATAGTVDEIDATARYGGALAADGAYRVWARYADTPSFDLLAGGSANDQWTRRRGGFRMDFGSESTTSWMVQGETYDYPTQRVTVRQPVPGRHLQFEQLVTDDDLDGGHLMVRAERGVGRPRGWSAHAYFDRSDRHTSRVGIRRETFDLDFRNWLSWGEQRANELVWGAELFATEDEIDNGPTFIFDPVSRSWTSFNGFVQYTRELLPDRFHLMVGTKLTDHDFVGFEVQPSVRAWWTPSARQTVWAGVSRPVRVPSRLEEEGFIVVANADPGILAGGPPTGAIPFGVGPNAELEQEELLAYELGHRIRPFAGLEVDTALFYNDFSRLIGIVSPIMPWTDAGEAEVHGAEIVASWRPARRLRVEGWYSFLEVDIAGAIQPSEEDNVPEQLAHLRASWDLSERLALHGVLYRVGRLTAQQVDGYERLDLGVTWSARPELELALWGENLLDDEHAEISGVAIPRAAHLVINVDL